MASLMIKGFFLFLFILPDVLLCAETEWPLFVEDDNGNRFYTGLLPNDKRLPEKQLVELRSPLPKSFDAREQWPECKNIIGLIRDQKNCGSCWAFSVTEVISDRICINSKGNTKEIISPEDLMTCCKGVGCGGCQGGNPQTALEYWKDNGIVTGGDYKSRVGCRPYTITDDWNEDNTPPCNKTCEEGYPIAYTADKHHGADSYSIKNDMHQIQIEIYDNGPVSAFFKVYKGFTDYTSGVYNHTISDEYALHAIKIIGWGVENDTPYWLCANSWGAGWGDKGYFKMLRGNPEYNCGIEKNVNAGTPKL